MLFLDSLTFTCRVQQRWWLLPLGLAAVFLPTGVHAFATTTTTSTTTSTPTAETPEQQTNTTPRILTDTEVHDYPILHFGPDLEEEETPTHRRSLTSQRTCKNIPGDANWPSALELSILDLFVTDLAAPAPIASPCYAGGLFDADACNNITSLWSDSTLHENHQTSIMSPLFQGLTCLPLSIPGTESNCTAGGYPVHVVTAHTVADIQAAVNFARNTNIRLVIKNTGHDFAGRSSGSHSLSVRTHLINDITFVKEYEGSGYKGPAFKAGAGVQSGEIYAAANAAGMVVVGGEGVTVGWGGGYLQGGGHSPLSSVHGMGADHALAYEVVLANGRFVTADPDTNSDLFWALRGGGGSTFGVVTSVTIKAYPSMPVTISQFMFETSAKDLQQYSINNDTGRDDFWSVVRAYLHTFPTNADEGTYSYFNIFPGGTDGSLVFSMVPFFGVNKTPEEVNTLLEPLLSAANAVSIPLTLNTTSFDTFHDAWSAGFPKEAVGVWNGQLGSRLFPRSNWANDTIFNATFSAIKNQVNNDSYLIAFNMAPTLAAGGNPDNAVNPAWRDAVMHAITGVSWSEDLVDLGVIGAIRRDFTEVKMQKWRDISPGSGAYLGEADINEPDRQQAFWGANYPRLYKIKQEYDPTGVFFAETAVGSEDWSTGPDRLGRLCPVGVSSS